MEREPLLILIQLAATLILVGITWFIQLIHYPLYKKIKEGFVEYERSHLRRMAILVGPLMAIEAITAILLLGCSTPGPLTQLAVANLVLLILVWIATFLFQVHQHQLLSIHFSAKTLRSLLTTNRIRTLLWTLKGAVVMGMLLLLLA